MTLHEKIIELGNIGFDVKFEKLSFSDNAYQYQNMSNRISLRYHGVGSVKVENSIILSPKQMANENFVVAELERIYKQMKPYAIGHQTLDIVSSD